MPSTIRTYLIVLAALAVTAGAVFAASQVQRSAASKGFALTEAASNVRTAQVGMEVAFHGALDTPSLETSATWRRAQVEFDHQMTAANLAAAGKADLAESLEFQEQAAESWRTWAVRAIQESSGHENFDAGAILPAGDEHVDRFRTENEHLRTLVADDRETMLGVAQRISVILIAAITLLVGVVGYVVIVRAGRRRASAEQLARSSQRAQQEFSETLQVMRDESEAQELVRRHLERQVPDGEVVVLNRNNSDDRLEAATPLAASSPLAEVLADATPEACLSVRLGREHVEGGDSTTLLSCEVCGRYGDATCVPSLVGGEVIGSVLVSSDGPLGEHGHEMVRQTVAQAAPVLANLRSLSIAESRASTDELTGLPNKRDCDDTLRRMLAQATRTMLPLSVVLLDLDHFKRTNDRYGHGVGDDALAAVGAAIGSHLRTADFGGRYGGEEFLLLLPATDSAGARRVADELRHAIAKVRVPKLDRRLSASFGIASHPEHALDGETLLRMADRALYAAKAAGRNQVVVAEVVIGESPSNGDVPPEVFEAEPALEGAEATPDR